METLTHTEETLVETSTATCYFRTTLFFCLTAEHDCFFFVVCFFFSDVDECLSGPVCGPDARCHNTNGSFYCSCQRDFVPSVGTKHFHPETGVRCKGWWEDICRKSTPAATDMFGWFVFFFFHAHSWLEAQDETFLFFFPESVMQHIKSTDNRVRQHFLICSTAHNSARLSCLCGGART